MKKNPTREGALVENSVGPGTVTHKQVRKRAVELAISDGRSAQDMSKSDWEQARLELTGDAGTDPKEMLLESAPESGRWDPVPGSEGRKMPVTSSTDEDDEGRSDNELLVDEGIEAAEHDQMRQAGLKPDN